VIFRGSSAHAELVTKIHFTLYASHAAVPKDSFENFAKIQASHRYYNFLIMQSSKHKTSQNSQLSADSYVQQSTSHHATFSISQWFTFFQTYLHQKDKRALPGII
jgi:hypothetical protein